MVFRNVIVVMFALGIVCYEFITAPKVAISQNKLVVIVAVIDTGVDIDNETIATWLWKNNSEIPDNGIDDDSNGYVDDYYGFNAISSIGSGIDGEGHGTAVTAVALGLSSNSTAIPITSQPYIKVLPIRTLNGRKAGSVESAIIGLQYAIAVKKNTGLPMVINLSWVFTNDEPIREVYDVLKEAERNNILVVASVGNDYRLTSRYPAAFKLKNIISVSAATGLQLADYANGQADICADGTDITTIGLYNRVVTDSGTSFSAPVVTLVAALIESQEPFWSYKKVRHQILKSADIYESLQFVKGKRKLNRKNALAFAQ